MLKRKVGQQGILNLFLSIFAVLVFVMPVIRLAIMSLTLKDGIGLDHFQILLQEERTLRSIKNTLIIAAGSTGVAVCLGGILAWVIAYLDIKRKKLIEVLILAQYIIPSYVVTLAWSSFLQEKGPVNSMLTAFGLPSMNLYSIGGIILILGICNTPLVYLMTINLLRKIPRDLEWACRVSGYSQWETMIKVNLVQVMPALIGGGILSFLSAIDNFSVPAFLGISSGIPVLSTYIYEKAISFGPSAFSLAAALSMILSIIAISGALLQGRLIRKSSGLESVQEDYSVRIQLKQSTNTIIEWVLLCFLCFINVIPLLSMVLSSFQKFYGAAFDLSMLSLKNYQFAFTNRGIRQAAYNSLFLALAASGICICLGTAIAYIKVRGKGKIVQLVEYSASLTYALPGIVLALAMIFHWTAIPNVYGTIKILLIAYVTRYLILQIKGSTTALLAVEPSLEEAAAVSGSTRGRTWRVIIVPMISKAVLSSSLFIFISSVTELTLSSMLAAAGTKTVGLTIFNLQQAGDYSASAALSTLLVIFILSGYGIILGLKELRPKRIKLTGIQEQRLTEMADKPC